MVVPSGNALYLLHIARPHVAPRVCKGGIDDIAEVQSNYDMIMYGISESLLFYLGCSGY